MEITLTEMVDQHGVGRGMTGSKVAGMMASHVITGFDMEKLAAAGQLTGVRTITKFGMNDAVGTTMQDIQSQGGILNHPTVAGKVKLISTATGDNHAGLGAREVFIGGIDGSYNYVSEIMQMHATDGTVLGPESVNDYLFIYSMRMTSRGTLMGWNLGHVDAEFTSTPGTSVCRMPFVDGSIGAGGSMTTHYVVPAGKIAFVHPLSVSTETSKTIHSSFHVMSAPTDLTTAPYDGVNFSPIHRQSTSGGNIVDWGNPFFLSEKMHVWLSGHVVTGSAFVFARYDILEMDAFE